MAPFGRRGLGRRVNRRNEPTAFEALGAGIDIVGDIPGGNAGGLLGDNIIWIDQRWYSNGASDGG